MNQDLPATSAWIFVSHSLKDWDKVRVVRNLLEDRGHRPLLFFLRCVNDRSELHELIKREIRARKWFVLCDSENSKKSRWVQEEVEIIKGLPGKIYETVDLQTDLDKQIRRIDALSRRITVYISYSHRDDRSFAHRLKQYIGAHGYSVFDFGSLSAGSDWRKEAKNAIDDATKRGFFLVLLSPSALQSKAVKDEVIYALEKFGSKGCNIIPIMIEQVSLRELDWDTESPLDHIQYLDFTKGEFDYNMSKLLKNMQSAEIE